MKIFNSNDDINKIFFLDYDQLSSKHNREKRVERRAHKRFIAKRGAFALIGPNLRRSVQIKTMSMGEIAAAIFKSNPIHLGRIMDINLEGIALYYIDSNVRPEETSDLDILLAEGRFYLANIPFKIISDFEIADELPGSALKMRQLGLQFKGLTQRQISHLDFFIKSHTLGAE